MQIRPSMTMVPLLATILVSPVVQAIGEPSSTREWIGLYSRHRSATDSLRWTTCPRGFVR